MGRQKKTCQPETGCFERVYESLETLFLFTVYVAANSTACYIDAESGAMMLVPSTLLLKRAGIVNTAFFVSVILASSLYLVLNKTDAFFIVLVHSIFLGVVTWVDAIRDFAPGVKKFVLCLLCLKAIAIALVINVVVAFALAVAMAACLIKIYQINPEPVILLFMHTIVSGSMLYDPITTFAIITVVLSAAATFRDYEVPKERVAVFVMSIITTAFFGTVMAAVASVIIGIGIVFFKLRPVDPPTLALMALGSLALILLANKVAGSIVIFIFIAALTALFVINKLNKNQNLQQPDPLGSTRRKTSHPNGYLALSNITESLDLHGHTVTGAMKVMHEFLREHEDEYRKNRAQHVRHVTIITGEGNHSDPHDSANLVKPTVVNFLKINKYKYEVSSDCPGLIKVDLESHIF